MASSAAAAAPSLRFVEKVTLGAAADSKLPMVVAIHGLGDRPESFVGLFDDAPVAMRVIALEAPDKHGPGFSWFSIDDGLDAAGPGIDAAADRVAQTIEALVASRPTRDKPVITGFSQGGALSFAVALRRPDLVRLAVPMGGWLPRGSWPRSRASSDAPQIVALHGDADARVPIDPTRELVGVLRERGWNVSLEEHARVQHTITAPMRVRLFELLSQP